MTTVTRRNYSSTRGRQVWDRSLPIVATAVTLGLLAWIAVGVLYVFQRI